jgi:SAM-dependent methyltransferase
MSQNQLEPGPWPGQGPKEISGLSGSQVPGQSGKALFEAYHRNYRAEISTRFLEAGIELGLFDYLLEPHHSGEIIRELKIDPVAGPIFLKTLTLLGLLVRNHDRYQTCQDCADLFTTNAPFNIANGVRQFKKMVLSPLTNIGRIIRDGIESDDTCPESEQNWAEAAKAGALWAFYGAGEKLADILEQEDGFSDFTGLLDLGGGHGVFSIYLAARNPKLMVNVFDRPEVLQTAGDFIRQYGFENQIRLFPGDYFTDELGQNYDVVLANGSLNFAYAGQALSQVIGKVWQALKPGGLFVSLHDVYPPPGELPMISGPILENLAFSLLSGVDMTLMSGAIAKASLEQGFRRVRTRPFNSSVGQLELDIAVK